MDSGKLYTMDWGRQAFVWLLAIAAVLMLGVPILFLVLASLRGPPEYLPIESGAKWTLENFRYFYFDRQLYTEILPNTFLIAGASLVVSCAVALALAWRFERRRSRSVVLARLLILAPMAIPTPALAVAWMQLLGPNMGWINQAIRSVLNLELESGPFNIFSIGGIIWCQGIAGIPMAYLLLSPAVRSIRGDLEEAGFAAGGGPGVVLHRISLPMALPSLAGPLLILFLIALEQVDFPYILGQTAGVTVLGTRILWEATAPSGLPNIGATSAAAMLMLLVAFMCLMVHDRLLRRNARGASVLQRESQSLQWSSSWLQALVWVVLGAHLLLSFVMPMTVLVAQSLGLLDQVNLSGSNEFHGLAMLVRDDRFIRALMNTLIVASSSALIGTAIGVGIGLTAASGGDRISAWLNVLSIGSVAVPPLLVAFGAALVFMSIPIGVYGTVGILVIAYSYRIALSTRLARGALMQIGSSLQEAAAVSGATWVRTQFTIVLPLILPSIVASAAFLFVVGIREFIIPVMLYSPSNAVLSVLLLQLQQAGDVAAASAAGLVMTGLTLAGVLVLVLAERRLWRLGNRGRD